MKNRTPAWLNEAVFYQIYPQSFYDSNGDGIGDLNGIIRKLDYIQALGVNALWLNPLFVSPFQDAGYDVADFYRVAPRHGTNRDLRRLFQAAHRRGIRVCLDLVAGHTSIQHPWFKKSSQPGRNRYTDRYIWNNSALARTDGELPFIKGLAQRNGSYAANFFYCQPALNYGFAQPDPRQPWQQPVNAPGPLANRRELIKIITFWSKMGADGFRVDMASSLVKNDPGHRETIRLWQDIRRELRGQFPEMALIAEWGNPPESIAAGFNLDFMFHFGVAGYGDLLLKPDCFFRKQGGRDIQGFLKPYLDLQSMTAGQGFISLPSSNHDFERPSSGGRTVRDLKAIYTFLLTWPGVPFIYYGDEIGMRYIPGMKSKEGGYERTGTRTPMQWNDGMNAGFSTAPANDLYLPVDPRASRPNVAAQENDPHSLLNHVRQLITLRRKSPALQAAGEMIALYTGGAQFVYLRRHLKQGYVVALNPSNQPAQIEIKGWRVENNQRKIGQGVKAAWDGQKTTLMMGAVSSAVFELPEG